MTTIRANVSKMFAHREPWDVSNSVANLGPRAAKLTWECALEIARDYASWLISDLADAVEGMSEWARETGAWTDEEIRGWSRAECLALFVQNVARELRMLGADDTELTECVEKHANTDWNEEMESPRGCYYGIGYGDVGVDYYTGV